MIVYLFANFLIRILFLLGLVPAGLKISSIWSYDLLLLELILAKYEYKIIVSVYIW